MSIQSQQLQARKIDEYRALQQPYHKTLAGLDIIVSSNVYPGGTDSELLCETIVVKDGDTVLDLCTGNGIVALSAAIRGARQVIGTDINPAAVDNAKQNQGLHKLTNLMFMQADLFPQETDPYDIITINPPYTDIQAPDVTARCFWDKDNVVVKTFFAQLKNYLSSGGAAYITWSSFGDQELLPILAAKHGYILEEAGSRSGKSGFTYFVYRIKAIKKSA